MRSTGEMQRWPIENLNHPGIRKFNTDKGVKESEPESEEPVTGTEEERSPETALEQAKDAFANPDALRAAVLEHIRVEPTERLDGESFLCIWPNKHCPVGCSVCFFNSPEESGGQPTDETRIPKEFWGPAIETINSANVRELVIAGGGEPFLRRAFVERMFAEAKAKNIFLSTSGIWAQRKGSAETIVEKLFQAHKANVNNPVTDIRLSFDEYHAEKISPDGDLDYAKNLLAIFQERYSDEKNFRVSFHSMDGDPTMERLIRELPTQQREWKDNKTEIITLENGYQFEIRWKRLFHSDPEIDMHDTPAVDRNIEIFDEDINSEHSGNMSVVFNEGKPKGSDLLVHYDGTILNWGASSPDNESSLYKGGYKAAMQKAFDDVLALSFLEKGNTYREGIVAEVNPTAVRRAKAMNLRDFYSRAMLEEARTRLYLSIRVTQDYIREGRVSENEVQQWPKELQQLIAMTPSELQEGYHASNYTIVHQYLSEPSLDETQLAHLFSLVRKGHYDVTPQQMLQIVEESDFAKKNEFRERAADELAQNVKTAFEISRLEDGQQREDESLVDASHAVCLSREELKMAKEKILSALPAKLQLRFRSAFDFLERDHLDDHEGGKYPIDGETVYVEVLHKPGKGKEGAVSEVHAEHTDIQMNVGGEEECIGLNSKGTATLTGSTPDPKREGRHLTSRPDQWRQLGRDEIMILFPGTPHAPGGGDSETLFKKLIVKVKTV